MRLKSIGKQTIVITGATSGIGLTTARIAARRGAKVVLAARNVEVLERITTEIRDSGGDAMYVAADVAQEDQVLDLASRAIERFGGFDTWVNNAGVSIYGPLLDVSMEDNRRLFETNFWGVVHGCRAAVPHLRMRGGALINIGSVLSDEAIPLQGMYCASKHALQGFTDALRLELEKEGAPISVTHIKPSAIDTPYKQHAKNYLDVEPENPPPVYAPEAVAEAILHCAQHPEREMVVGGGGKMLILMGKISPALAATYKRTFMFGQQKSERPAQQVRPEGLHGPGSGGEERGGYSGHVASTSLYTKASMHPMLSAALALGAGLLLAGVLKRRH
jgi:short-subunit dehydrogenase